MKKKQIVLKLSSLLILFFISRQLLSFPVFRIELIFSLIIYLSLISLHSRLWLVILPALVPIVDLTPWSGRILITAFDLFILTTIAVSLLFNRINFNFVKQPGNIRWLIILLTISYFISTLIGFLNLKQSDSSSFYLYLTEYNSLRIAKGYFFALLFLPLLAYEKERGINLTKTFSLAMLLGLIFINISIVWERFVFPGLLNFSMDYRISGLFSGMRLGGIMIDAYLFMSFPFIIVLFYHFKSYWIRVFGLLLFSTSIYSILVTYTRINYLAIVMVMLILVWGHRFIQKKSSWSKVVFSYICFFIISLLITTYIFKGGYITQRFSTSIASVEQRINHWQNTIQLHKQDLSAILLGNGVGSYPNIYINNDAKALKMARFWLKKETLHGQTTAFIRLSPSGKHNLNIIQRFSVTDPGSYTINIKLRNHSAKPQLLMVEFCKKNILYFNKECPWLAFQTIGNNQQWQTISKKITFENFFKQTLSHITPFDINLLNRGLHKSLDISQVEIITPGGRQILQNSNFNEDFDHWFFSVGNALPWTIDSLWLSLFFETGLLGFMLFTLFTFIASRNLVKSLKEGNFFALAIFSSVFGVLFIGLLGSPFDEPRISWLYYFMLYIALLEMKKSPQLRNTNK